MMLMVYQQITPEKRALIVEALKSGEGKEAIRNRLHTGWTTVKRIAIEEGFETPTPKAKAAVRAKVRKEPMNSDAESSPPLELGETWIEIRIVVDDEERLMLRTKPLTHEAAMLLVQKVVESGLTR